MSYSARRNHAACTGPSGNERDLIYNSDYHTYQFCNGTSWMRAGPISTVTPTAANGYFVLTSTTYNGNLGGYIGANGKCLTELTTNTSWKGYATAKYLFAYTGDASMGGVSFTTDSQGIGPYDSATFP